MCFTSCGGRAGIGDVLLWRCGDGCELWEPILRRMGSDLIMELEASEHTNSAETKRCGQEQFDQRTVCGFEKVTGILLCWGCEEQK